MRALLDREEGIQVIGEASGGREAVEMVSSTRPDVVVMDLGMPGLNGVDATRQVVQLNSGCKVLTLSMHSDCRFVAESLRAGASGYLVKGCGTQELVTAIRVVSSGRTYISPTVAGAVVADYVNHLQTGHGASKHYFGEALSPREREVLQLIAEGHSTKCMATTLGVSVKTIETHRRQIMIKLDIDSLAGLTKYAVREGLTSLDS